MLFSADDHQKTSVAIVVCERKANSAKQMEEAWERGNLATAHYPLMTGHYAQLLPAVYIRVCFCDIVA